MIIYPAIDVMGGRVVRLRQGRFNDVTTYPADIAGSLERFADAGAEWAHIVDLEGARMRSPIQHDLIAGLAQSAPLKLQIGGGFRTRSQISQMLSAGVSRVVIGSLAIREPGLVSTWINEFGAERIALSFDVKFVDAVPMVCVSGWAERSGKSLWEAASHYPDVRHVLITDIGKDGMLAGPNVKLLDEAVDRLPGVSIQASGGISSIDDLRRLRTAGAIVGRALWEERIDLAEAVTLACA